MSHVHNDIIKALSPMKGHIPLLQSVSLPDYTDNYLEIAPNLQKLYLRTPCITSELNIS